MTPTDEEEEEPKWQQKPGRAAWKPDRRALVGDEEGF